MREIENECPMRAMALRWEDLARRKFDVAENETDAMGKRMIEHGAMCYYNCAIELLEFLNGLEATSKESQKTS